MLLEPERGVPRAGDGEHGADRIVALRVRERMAPRARPRRASHPRGVRRPATNRAAFDATRSGSRDAGRAGRRASRRRAARRADTRRGSTTARRRASAEPRAARPSGESTPASPQDGERGRVDGDMELVAGRLLERTTPVGADLRPNAEAAEQRERATRDRGADQVEVDGDRAVAQVPRAGRVEERRELGEPAAARDRARSAPARRGGRRRGLTASRLRAPAVVVCTRRRPIPSCRYRSS